MATTHRYALFAAAALVLWGTPARAADQTILGRLLLVKDPAPDASPDPTKRKIKVYGKELPSTNTIVGDPTTAGASLRVIANGANDYDQTFPMPAAGWAGIPGLKLKYSDAGVYGPVRKAVLYSNGGKFILKALVSGELGLITIEAPNQGTDGAVVLSISGGDNYCMMFGGAAGGTLINFPSGNPFKVFAVKRATVETGCPPPPP